MKNKKIDFLATSTPKKEDEDDTLRKGKERNGDQTTKSKIPYRSRMSPKEANNDKENEKANLKKNYSPTNIPKPKGPRKLESEYLKDTIKKRKSNNHLITMSPIISHESDNKKACQTSSSSSSAENSNEDFGKNKISVAVRIRPISDREMLNHGLENILSIRNNALYVEAGSRKKTNLYKFDVDYILQSFDVNNVNYCSQQEVYETIGAPLLEAAFKGYNACLLAYGQTGSGKSFSMMGRNESDIDSEEYSGIIPRFCKDLIARINNFPDNRSANLKISYFEIYKEKIYDLLTEDVFNRSTLKVRENPVSGCYVENLSLKDVKSYEEIRLWLLIGNRNRAIAATNMNEKSSRSHSIFKVDLNFLTDSQDGEEEGSRSSSVSLVDLAGNERILNDKTRNWENVPIRCDEKHRESVSINKSLLTLAHVISSLAEKRTHIPYRDSVLTRLLKENIGGNSLTTMLTTISPSILSLEETLATLRFACKAKQIVNTAHINENPQEKIIRELKSEVLKLKLLQNNYEATINSVKNLQHSENNISQMELEKLQIKLDETEKKLVEAELSWKTKFEESKAAQMTSSAQLEKLKEELESNKRILSNSNKYIDLTLFKSNFLEELENILEEDADSNLSVKFALVIEWCRKNSINYYSNSQGDLVLTDYKNKTQALITTNDLSFLSKYRDIDDMMSDIIWRVLTPRKLREKDIIKSINSLYISLTHILPQEENEDLDILYTNISKSLQKYENLLLNSLKNKKSNCN